MATLEELQAQFAANEANATFTDVDMSRLLEATADTGRTHYFDVNMWEEGAPREYENPPTPDILPDFTEKSEIEQMTTASVDRRFGEHDTDIASLQSDMTQAQTNISTLQNLISASGQDIIIKDPGAVTQLWFDDDQSRWDFVANAIVTTGTLNCGAFTSTGIDDNASGERIEIQDLAMVVGPTTATGNYAIHRPINDGSITINSGTNTAIGGNIALFGPTHASQANTIWFRENGVQIMRLHPNTGVSGVKGGSLVLKESTAEIAPVGQYGQIWVKNDTPNTLHFEDDAGEDWQISPSYGFFNVRVHDGTASDALGQSISTQTNYYQKIGAMVFISIDLTMSALGSLSGQLYLKDIPYTASGAAGVLSFLTTGNCTLPSGTTPVGYIGNGQNYVTMKVWDSTAAPSPLTEAHLTDTSRIVLAGWIPIDNPGAAYP